MKTLLSAKEFQMLSRRSKSICFLALSLSVLSAQCSVLSATPGHSPASSGMTQPINMDLSSSKAELPAPKSLLGHAVSIIVGGQSQTITGKSAHPS